MELSPQLTLDQIGLALPVFQALFPYDVYIDVSDRERFVYVAQAQGFQLDVKPGDPIPRGSMAEKMFATGKPTAARATRETTLFGFPYIARGIPLLQDGVVIGTMSLAMNVDDMEKMEELSKRLLNFLEVSNQRIQELSAGSQELAATATQMIDEGEVTRRESQKMLASLSEVQKIAKQSHVLSINTSIEAARLGDAGRSFQVISQYMQNLASSSLEAGDTIDKGLTSFQADLSATLNSLGSINHVVQRQTVDIVEMANAGREVEGLAEALSQISLFNFDKK